MFLVNLWTECLSKTMPALTPGGVPLVVIQMLGGLPSLVGLLWRLLFGERVGIGDETNHRCWLRRYLGRGCRAYGWSRC